MSTSRVKKAVAAGALVLAGRGVGGMAAGTLSAGASHRRLIPDQQQHGEPLGAAAARPVGRASALTSTCSPGPRPQKVRDAGAGEVPQRHDPAGGDGFRRRLRGAHRHRCRRRALSCRSARTSA